MDRGLSRKEQLAWAAGLFEGEGSFGCDKRTRNIHIELSSTDADVLQRFAAVVGAGRIEVKGRATRRGKTVWTYRLQSVEQVRETIHLFLPHLGERRQSRALEVLAHAEGNRGRGSLRTHCKHGHEFTPENTLPNSSGKNRRCRACQNAYHRRLREQKKSHLAAMGPA